MKDFENSFVRSQSPTYSEGIISNYGMSTLQHGDKRNLTDNFVRNNNVGYEPMLQKKFPRGRNTFAFWTLVSLLFLLTLGNLLLTITIVGVLRLGKGMQSLELVPEEETIKFFGTTDLDRVYKKDGLIEGFENEPVVITGDESSVAVNLLHRNGHSHNKMNMNKSGTNFKGIDKFEIKHPLSGDTVFTTHHPHYVIPKGAKGLQAKSVSGRRITSQIDEPLKITSDTKISAQGSEGLFMDAKNFSLQSDLNIKLASKNGSIVLMAANGVYINIDGLPVVNSEYGLRTGTFQYKICVCMPQGKLFRIAVPRTHNGKVTCAHYNPNHDPCM